MNEQQAGNNSTNTVSSMDQSTVRRLVLAAREEAVRVLSQLLGSAFEHLDDALFEHAEKSPNDAVQNRFIHAVRELRQLRKPVSAAFLQQVQINLEHFFAVGHAADRYPDNLQHPDPSPDVLALLNNSELEEDLAVLTVIAKGEKHHHYGLGQLTALWASFTGRQAMATAENPIGPDSLANQFRLALAVWPGEPVVRPVIYEVFYEYVIAALDELYQKLANDMREAGVQPASRASQVKPTSSTRSPKRNVPPADEREASGEPAAAGLQDYEPGADAPETSIFGLVTLIRSLLDSQRQSLGLPAKEQVAGDLLKPMRPSTLVNLLSRLQQEFADGSYFDLQAAVDSNDKFKSALNYKLDQVAKQQHQQVHALDQHIVDVVMMLFDFVLEDPAMPASMKVIVARLQIPILQVAVGDRVFLSDRSHPVRSLLNNLSRAAMRWADDEDYSSGSLYGMIEHSVNRIVSSQEQNAALYAEVNRDFLDYQRSEESAAKIAEERLNQVTRGQEQLTICRQRVSTELDRLMNDQVPVAVYTILSGAWRDVLTLTLLREGEDSSSWTKMLRVAERLIDSVIPRTQEWERQKIMRDIPLLLADLREGFFSISYDAGKTASLLKQLQLCHIAVLRGSSPRMQPGFRKHGQDQLFADTEYSDDSHLLMAESLELGQWLSWLQQDGKEMRAKLSWRSEIADLLLFVDSHGRKVIEMSNEDLGHLFHTAQARVIREIDEPIMDRAMRSVYNMLRQTISERGDLPV